MSRLPCVKCRPYSGASRWEWVAESIWSLAVSSDRRASTRVDFCFLEVEDAFLDGAAADEFELDMGTENLSTFLINSSGSIMIPGRDFQLTGKWITAGIMVMFLVAFLLLITMFTAPRHFHRYPRVLWFQAIRWDCRPFSDSLRALLGRPLLMILEILSNLFRSPRLRCRMKDRQESCSAPSSLCISAPCVFPAEKITPELRAALQVCAGEVVARSDLPAVMHVDRIATRRPGTPNRVAHRLLIVGSDHCHGPGHLQQ